MMRGACLCGAVSFEVEGEFEHAPEACHCSQCRKQSGHVWAGVNVRRTAITLRGAERVTWYRSSEKVRRGFCSVCGSSMFWDPTVEGYEWTSIAMGLFESPTGTRLAKHTFVDDKGDYYDIGDGLPQSRGSKMISRHWRGLVRPDQARAYEKHLLQRTLPELEEIPGFVDVALHRRRLEGGVEFLVVTRWESMEAISKFAGADPEAAVVPDEVDAMMVEYDRRARHFELVERPGNG